MKTTKKTPAKKAVSKKPHEQTTAVHVANGDEHLIGLKALRVLLSKDGDSWFAQGLEIDYAAAGATVDEVKENFSKGLMLTIREHLMMHGNIKSFLMIAPQEAWDEYYAAPAECIKQKYATLQLHQLNESAKSSDQKAQVDFPFGKIAYIEPMQALQAA